MDNGAETAAYEKHLDDIARRVVVVQHAPAVPPQPPAGLNMTRSDWGKVIVGWLAALAVFAFTWYGTTNSAIQERPTAKEVNELIAEDRRSTQQLDDNQREITKALVRLQTQIENLTKKVEGLAK